MGLRTILLSLLVLSITALCSADVPQDQLTWRVMQNHARVSVRTADEEMSGDGVGSGSGSGSGSGVGCEPPVPTLGSTTQRFAQPPFLSNDECRAIAAGSGQMPLPARSLEELQLHAMCELTCINNTVSIITAYGLYLVGYSSLYFNHAHFFVSPHIAVPTKPAHRIKNGEFIATYLSQHAPCMKLLLAGRGKNPAERSIRYLWYNLTKQLLPLATKPSGNKNGVLPRAGAGRGPFQQMVRNSSWWRLQ